ncbi:DUF397 domain-containing protein [Actinomadura luteofluorescens]|uniref:DUF397 domain-containing protein n=1 Tax=Actinomadura luteofluorescens TaxID=46163 RepID=A0A7Y9EP13_9ACTN|nr:DUF397 domain-containing protein [Actinomadura luteofluorescens]NYD51315.1 hypothetical protein [Actinomadura luteofluorescens]
MTSAWRKSSHSGGATDEACVELAALPEGVGVRDSKDPEGGRLTVSGVAFGSLLRRIKDGALDRA